MASILGVSAPTARKIAQTDPEFPPVTVLGPRTRTVVAEELQQYLAKRRQAPQVQHIPTVKV